MLSKFEFRIPKNDELCVWYKPGSKFHGHTYRCKLEIGTNCFNYVIRTYTLLPVVSSFTKTHHYCAGMYSSILTDTWPPEMFIVNNLDDANYINIIINEQLRISRVKQMYHNKHISNLVRNKHLESKQLNLF